MKIKILLFIFSLNLSLRREFNKISIAFNTDNNYILPFIVTMTSIMENSKEDTFITFYILTGNNFKYENKIKFTQLKDKYFNLNVEFINLGNKFKEVPVRKWATSSLYRVALPEALPYENKIIYLDGDTIILDDLREMYNIDMGSNLVMGFLDPSSKLLNKFGLYNELYINAGVMLMNLRDMRKFDSENKINNFIKEHINDLDEIDQTIINYVFNKHKGILPAKYGIWNYDSFDSFKINIQYSNAKYRYSEEEMKLAYDNPVVLHFIYKPWSNLCTKKYKNIYLQYVDITDYKDEIYKKYFK